MSTSPHIRALPLAAALALVACDSPTGGSPIVPAGELAQAQGLPPAALVTVSAGGESYSIWPFTGVDLAGSQADPINLVFAGHADQRGIRQALMSLDGDRTNFGFPDVFPFNCTWSDAMGDLQAAFSAHGGWAGSAIQLGCGQFETVRFHLRLFDVGEITLGGVHFEVLIPGTADHQVISWELAEQLVIVDMMRAGVVPPNQISVTGQINPIPFRTIPAVLYNGLPAELQAAVGGPVGQVADDVGIGTDGRATVLNIPAEIPVVDGVDSDQTLALTYDQTIPRPFCSSGPLDWVHVTGPIDLRKRVAVAGSGRMVSEYHASGRLTVTPLDVTGAVPVPSGPPYEAQIQDSHETAADDDTHFVRGLALRTELPPSADGRGKLKIKLRVGPSGLAEYDRSEDCSE